MCPLGIDDRKVQKMHNRKDIKGLVRALNDKNPTVKRSAAWALLDLASEIKEAYVVDALIASLQDSLITGIAIQALAEIGDKRAVEPLLPLLSGHKSRGVAAYALGVFGEQRAVEPIMELLKDKDYSVRRQAAEALGKIGDQRAADALLKVSLEDPDSDVRSAATRALERMGDTRKVIAYLNEAVTQLIKAYNQEPQGFRSGGMRFAMTGMIENQVRVIGQKLNEYGGLELMNRAFEVFCGYTNWPKHIPQDLRKVWDGIGDWKA